MMSTYISGQTNTVHSVFMERSKVPVELRQIILDSVNSQCENLVGRTGLREISTQVTSLIENKGPNESPLTHRYFTTKFRSYYYSKSKYINMTNITVESAVYGFARPQDNLEVIAVTSKNGCRSLAIAEREIK